MKEMKRSSKERPVLLIMKKMCVRIIYHELATFLKKMIHEEHFFLFYLQHSSWIEVGKLLLLRARACDPVHGLKISILLLPSARAQTT